ncbi:putative neprosin [Lupinus albus]|uniref:Putative neprosin n=1 Tax=Lupinus albus TaxID=3870 RepID=A0A6A4NCF3_LUPAL|nr:putative neprosin [Lupinus albus]
MWVLAGGNSITSTNDVNSIEIGAQVNPTLNGDNKTRLFVSWTNDEYRTTGCYNLLCPGFVQVNNQIVLGSYFDPISSYGDKIQRMGKVFVWKESEDGN